MGEEREEEGLSALLRETRTFPPPDALARRANAQPGIYDEATADPLAFWAAQAEHLHVGHAVDGCAGLVQRSLCQVVRRRASSTCRSTVSTGTSMPAWVTVWPSTGRENRGTPAPSPTGTCWRW